ncbi:hypothetical protein [Tenacibaculum aiptasiae]|uniref:hypothetical protein n=1 Tax=Tenacibaculum aiptasiae TaxID=426481 RepID=UPI00232C0BC7|nr:hypothetical protein [Tenacibaculum aiptasiae]
MKRIQLFEFEDFNWLPPFIRSSITNLLALLLKMLKTKDVVATLIINIKKQYDFKQIVDLGSGSGGVMLDVIQEINKTEEKPTNLLLTDLYPNPSVVNRINNTTIENVHYQQKSLNATDFENAPSGLKTMMNSFHHMSPKNAQQILQTAQENKQPLLIYEMGENNIPTLLWWLLLPISMVILIIMVLFMTPFTKGVTIKQIIFTYLIPIVPFIYAWDGQASLVRMYTFEDIQNYLLKNIKDNSYTWTIDHAKNEKGKKQGYYILGLPKKS